MKRSIVPRDITPHETPHEAEIVERLLERAATADVTQYRTERVAALQVVGGCDCGCSSLYFHSEVVGTMTMLADAVAIYPDHQKAGLILWGRKGEIVMLEVYEMDPVADRVPKLGDLRRWEDLYS